MITPEPRGFPAQSFTATVCDRFEDSKKGKAAAAVPIDLDTLFPTLRQSAPRPTFGPHLREMLPPTATVSIGYEEKKLMLPTGKKTLRKKGKHAGHLVDDKVMVMLVTVTATVSDGQREIFFRVTNRSRTVFDSRTKSRRPIEEVRRELLRMCEPTAAEIAGDTLASYLAPPPKPPPPRKLEPIANFVMPDAKDSGGIQFSGKRVRFGAKKLLATAAFLFEPRESATDRFERELRESGVEPINSAACALA